MVSGVMSARPTLMSRKAIKPSTQFPAGRTSINQWVKEGRVTPSTTTLLGRRVGTTRSLTDRSDRSKWSMRYCLSVTLLLRQVREGTNCNRWWIPVECLPDINRFPTPTYHFVSPKEFHKFPCQSRLISYWLSNWRIVIDGHVNSSNVVEIYRV